MPSNETVLQQLNLIEHACQTLRTSIIGFSPQAMSTLGVAGGVRGRRQTATIKGTGTVADQPRRRVRRRRARAGTAATTQVG